MPSRFSGRGHNDCIGCRGGAKGWHPSKDARCVVSDCKPLGIAHRATGHTKSPPLKEVLKPLYRLEAIAAAEYAEAIRNAQEKGMVAAAQKKVHRRKSKKR